MTPAKSELERIVEAYEQMASKARYRPAAPGDGLGSVELSAEELEDSDVLREEAVLYAKRFIEEENKLHFKIGISNWSTNRALVYTIEAARLMCGGMGQNSRALKLIKMAAEELKPDGYET